MCWWPVLILLRSIRVSQPTARKHRMELSVTWTRLASQIWNRSEKWISLTLTHSGRILPRAVSQWKRSNWFGLHYTAVNSRNLFASKWQSIVSVFSYDAEATSVFMKKPPVWFLTIIQSWTHTEYLLLSTEMMRGLTQEEQKVTRGQGQHHTAERAQSWRKYKHDHFCHPWLSSGLSHLLSGSWPGDLVFLGGDQWNCKDNPSLQPEDALGLISCQNSSFL